jgi:hypothetical protein
VSRLRGFRPRLFRLRGDELTCYKARAAADAQHTEKGCSS